MDPFSRISQIFTKLTSGGDKSFCNLITIRLQLLDNDVIDLQALNCNLSRSRCYKGGIVVEICTQAYCKDFILSCSIRYLKKLFSQFLVFSSRLCIISEECCELQTRKYLIYGFHNKQMSPDEYMGKLMDYKNESKPLNYLSVLNFCILIIWLVQLC